MITLCALLNILFYFLWWFVLNLWLLRVCNVIYIYIRGSYYLIRIIIQLKDEGQNLKFSFEVKPDMMGKKWYYIRIQRLQIIRKQLSYRKHRFFKKMHSSVIYHTDKVFTSFSAIMYNSTYEKVDYLQNKKK